MGRRHNVHPVLDDVRGIAQYRMLRSCRNALCIPRNALNSEKARGKND